MPRDSLQSNVKIEVIKKQYSVTPAPVIRSQYLGDAVVVEINHQASSGRSLAHVSSCEQKASSSSSVEGPAVSLGFAGQI